MTRKSLPRMTIKPGHDRRSKLVRRMSRVNLQSGDSMVSTSSQPTRLSAGDLFLPCRSAADTNTELMSVHEIGCPRGRSAIACEYVWILGEQKFDPAQKTIPERGDS